MFCCFSVFSETFLLRKHFFFFSGAIMKVPPFFSHYGYSMFYWQMKKTHITFGKSPQVMNMKHSENVFCESHYTGVSGKHHSVFLQCLLCNI